MISKVIKRKILHSTICQKSKDKLFFHIDKLSSSEEIVNQDQLLDKICLKFIYLCDIFIKQKEFQSCLYTMKLVSSILLESYQIQNTYTMAFVSLRLKVLQLKCFSQQPKPQLVKKLLMKRLSSYLKQIIKEPYYNQLSQDVYSNIELLYIKIISENLLQTTLNKEQKLDAQKFIRKCFECLKSQLLILYEYFIFQEKKVAMLIQAKSKLFLNCFYFERVLQYQMKAQTSENDDIKGKYLQVLNKSPLLIENDRFQSAFVNAFFNRQPQNTLQSKAKETDLNNQSSSSQNSCEQIKQPARYKQNKQNLEYLKQWQVVLDKPIEQKVNQGRENQRKKPNFIIKKQNKSKPIVIKRQPLIIQRRSIFSDMKKFQKVVADRQRNLQSGQPNIKSNSLPSKFKSKGDKIFLPFCQKLTKKMPGEVEINLQNHQILKQCFYDYFNSLNL